MKSILFTLGDSVLYSCKGGIGLGILSIHFNYSASFKIAFIVGSPASNDRIFDICYCISIFIILSAACIKKSFSFTFRKGIEYSINSIVLQDLISLVLRK